MTVPQKFEAGDHDRFSEGGLRAPAHFGRLRKVWWWFDFLVLVKLARLRFIAILTAIGLVIVYWDSLLARYDKWTRKSSADAGVESGVDYFCPMHPQVVTRDPKEKCPICFMNLSKRKTGSGPLMEALPPGVATRLQLSPYRVAAAGVQTWRLKPEFLVKRMETVGTLEFDERKLARISVRAPGKSRIDKLFANVTGAQIHKGDPLALVYSPELLTTVQNLQDARKRGNEDLERLARERLQLWGIEPDQIEKVLHKHEGTTHLVIRSPISGFIIRKLQVEGEYVEEGARLFEVADLSTIWIEAQVFEDDIAFLRVGLAVQATVKAFPGRLFPGAVAFVNPHLDAATRTAPVRFEVDNADFKLKPGMLATIRIDVPSGALGRGGSARDESVLAVPESSVIHTGRQMIVYRESAPNVFDAVAVQLGPALSDRAGEAFYPVERGLDVGDLIATRGSFLLDAETRVSSAAGSIYFGGGGGGKSHEPTTVGLRPTTPEDESVKIQGALAKLSTLDRRLAESQSRCPVRGSRLGEMGTPAKVVLDGEPVLLCCKGCESAARKDPADTLGKARRLKNKHEGSTQAESIAQTASNSPDASSVSTDEQRVIREALSRLTDADRRLAEIQVICPIVKDHLGSMGPPVKVQIKGRTVFLCCKGCEEEALAHPDKTLKALEEAKAKAEKATLR